MQGREILLEAVEESGRGEQLKKALFTSEREVKEFGLELAVLSNLLIKLILLHHLHGLW